MRGGTWEPLSRATDRSEIRERTATVTRLLRLAACTRATLSPCEQCGGHPEHPDAYARCACATRNRAQDAIDRCLSLAVLARGRR